MTAMQKAQAFMDEQSVKESVEARFRIQLSKARRELKLRLDEIEFGGKDEHRNRTEE